MIFQRIYFLDSADRFSAEFSQHLPSFGRFATSKKNALLAESPVTRGPLVWIVTTCVREQLSIAAMPNTQDEARL
jgi:hypothetical protein